METTTCKAEAEDLITGPEFAASKVLIGSMKVHAARSTSKIYL